MKENRFWKGSVVLLVLINIFLLVVNFLPPGKEDTHKGPPPGAPLSDMLIRELDFNEDQVAKFISLRDAHRALMNDSREKQRKIRSAFFAGLKDSSITDSIRNSIHSELTKLIKESDIITFQHFREVRALCDEGQKVKFDRIIEDIIEKIGRPGPPPPPPHHPN